MSGGIFALALEGLRVGGLEVFAAWRLHADGATDFIVAVSVATVLRGRGFAILDGGGHGSYSGLLCLRGWVDEE